MIIELETDFDEKEKKLLGEYNDIDIKLFIEHDRLRLSGIENGEKYTEILSKPRRMIGVGGLYLLELCDEPNEWYMGLLGKDSNYSFWGNYGDLEFALKSL